MIAGSGTELQGVSRTTQNDSSYVELSCYRARGSVRKMIPIIGSAAGPQSETEREGGGRGRGGLVPSPSPASNPENASGQSDRRSYDVFSNLSYTKS